MLNPPFIWLYMAIPCIRPLGFAEFKLHHRRPQTVGGFKTCWGTGSNTWHEKALRTPNRTLFGKKCKMRPPATGKQKERQTGRQYRRQDLGKADTPSNTKADTWRKPTPTVHCLKKCKIRPPATKGNKKKDKLGDKLGDKKEDKLGDKGDKGDKTSGRWTHHPTQRNKKRDNGRQGGDKTSGKWTHHATQVTRI